MITIRGYHGALPPSVGVKMDKIAKPVSPGCHYEWTFDGTVGEFAELWEGNFLALWDSNLKIFTLFISQYRTFSQR